MELDPVFLSRLQFAFVIAFHILLPAFTVGLASFIVLLEGLQLFRRNPLYLRLSVFWTRIFAVSFGMGVVSGIVMPFQFGTNWSRYTDATGNVLAGEVTGSINGVISIRTENGMIQAVSQKGFPPAEQERLRLAAGATLPLPADFRQRLDYLRDLHARAGRMERAGMLTTEEALQRQREVRSVWQRGLDAALEQGRISAVCRTQWIGALPE